MLPPYDNETLSVSSKTNARYDQPSRVRRSVSLYSEREYRKGQPFVLSVDLPPCKAETDFRSETCSMTQHLPLHVVDHKESYDGLPELRSLYSNSSLATIPHHDRGRTPTFPVLPHIRSGFGQPSTTASTLVLQMEHERERGNLSRCLKLAQEREELERELQRYTLERNCMREIKGDQLDFESVEDGGDELEWQYKSSTLPHRYPQGSKESSYFSPSPFSSSSVYWDAQPHPSLMPSRSRLSAASPSTPSFFKSGSHRTPPLFAKQTSFLSEEAGSYSKDRLTLPHLSSKHQRHERVEAAPEGYDNSPQSTVLEMQTNDSCSEARRQNNLSHGSLSVPSFHSNKYSERSNSALDAEPDSSKVEVALPMPTDEGLCVEMSVDEPELDVCVPRPAKPMLHHRIASHVQRGHSLTLGGRYEDMRRSTSLNCRSLASVDDAMRVPDAPPHSELGLRRASRQRSKILDPKQRSQSLDLRRRTETNFLTPDAWIDSLSQENCSVSSSCHPDSPFWKSQNSPSRTTSKSAVRKAAAHSPPPLDTLSPGSYSERRLPDSDVPCHYKPRTEASLLPDTAKWPVAYQKAVKDTEGYLEEASICLLPNNNDQEVLEVEAGGYEEVPESGSSYSSYASSGLGSMEPTGRRLSMCQLSPTLASSPETVEDTEGSTEDKHRYQMAPSQRY